MVKVPKGYRSKNVRDLRDGRGRASSGSRGFRFPTRSSGGSGGGLGGLGGALGGAAAGGALRRGGDGQGRKGCGCGGLALIVMLVLLALLFFSCVGTGTGTGTSTGSSTGGSSTGGATANTSPASDGEVGEAEDLVNFIFDDVQDFWIDEFSAAGQQYSIAQLTIFDDDVTTGGCGRASSAVGPFYCPADNNAYIDLVYMIRLQRQLGAEGDFSQAYILAHEVGHHVQNVLGTNAALRRAQSGATQTRSNQLQVMLELQADCFAGAWARDADERGDILEAGDLDEGVRAAGAVGDDAITGSNNQENFTHGSSAQRIEWFGRGYNSGIDACDTFNGALG